MARPTANTQAAPAEADERARQRKAARAYALVRLNECSKARQTLTGGALAPGTDETYSELTDADKRPPEAAVPLTSDVLDFQPDSPAEFSLKSFVKVLRSTARGASGGPGGTTYERLKVVLDDEDTQGPGPG